MQFEDLITVRPEQTELIEHLAKMMGVSFLEELWTDEWLKSLDALGTSDARKLEISQAILRYEFTAGSQYQACYTLPDKAAVAGGYLKSDLGAFTWQEIEDSATEKMAQEFLTKEERAVMLPKAVAMDPISDFGWQQRHAEDNDFFHFYALGVDSKKRGSGAFRRLMTPFFEHADAQGINCYLECYTTRLENLYSHFGFETVKTLSHPAFEIIEYCMVRTPQTSSTMS